MKLIVTTFAIALLSLQGLALADQMPIGGNPAPAPAPAASPNPGDEFNGGAPEAQFTRYSDDHIQLEIQNKAKIACKKDQCRLFSTSSHSDAFVVEFNVGYGNPNNNTGGSSVVVVGTTPYYPQPQPYIGLTLRYVNGTCTQDVQVPESLYISMNTYLYRLMNEDGSVRSNLSPAEQTMLMFYTTLMAQAKGCTPVTR